MNIPLIIFIGILFATAIITAIVKVVSFREDALIRNIKNTNKDEASIRSALNQLNALDMIRKKDKTRNIHSGAKLSEVIDAKNDDQYRDRLFMLKMSNVGAQFKQQVYEEIILASCLVDFATNARNNEEKDVLIKLAYMKLTYLDELMLKTSDSIAWKKAKRKVFKVVAVETQKMQFLESQQMSQAVQELKIKLNNMDINVQ